MALEVGRTTAVLEGKFEPEAFKRFDSAVDRAKASAKAPIVAHAKADADVREFSKFDQAANATERKSKNPIKRMLGADVERRGFDDFDKRVDGVERKSRNPLRRRAGLDVDDRSFVGFRRHADETDRSAGRLRGTLGSVAGVSSSVATGISAVGVAGVAAGFGVMKLVGAYTESYKIGKQTEAVLKSTGGVAKVTAEDVGNLATAISRKTGIDDEAIQSGENLLLTFTNIRNEAGRGNDIFNQTTQAAVDMATALGTDTATAAQQLGKALNDPEKGMTRLTKSGVTFTDQQKDQVKALVASGKTMDAQKLILRELDKEFGGSAKAQATNLDRLKVTFGNVAENLGGKLAPVIQKAAGWVDKFVNNLSSGGPAAKRFLDRLKPVTDLAGDIVRWVGKAAASIKSFFETARSSNAGSLAKILKNTKDTAEDLIGGVKRVGRAIKDAFAGKAGGDTAADLQKVVKAALSLAAAFTGVVKSVVGRAIPGIVTAVRGLATVVRGVVKVIAGILTLDFGKAWDGVKLIFSGAIKAIGGILRAGTAPIREGTARLFNGMKGVASAAWNGVTSVVRKGLDFLLGGVSTVQGAIASALNAAGKLPFVGGKFRGLANDVKASQKSIDKYRESLRETNTEHSTSSKRIDTLRGRVGTLRERLSTLRKGTSEYRSTAADLRKTQGTLNTTLGDADAKGRKGAKGMRTLGDAASSASGAVYGAGKEIGENVAGMAKTLGIKPIKFSFTPTKKNPLVGDSLKGLAVGGIPNPGSGARDDHMLIDPGGRPVALMSGTEGVLNSPQMTIVDQALKVASMVGMSPYGGLNDLWSSGMRHYAGGGQLGTPRLAGGGIVPVPGFPGERAASSVIPMIESIARRWHLTLSDAYGPGHKSPGHTQTGTAADFVGSDAAMDAAVRYLVGQGYVVGYDGRYGSMDWPGHGPAAGQGGSNAHLHVELGGKGRGGLGGVSLGAPEIGAPKITGPAGPMRDVARGASKRMAKNANDWLSKQTPTPVAGGGLGGKTSAGGKYNKARLAALWRAVNGGQGDPSLMAAIALAESGGDPNIVNSIGAGGLWQIHPPEPGYLDPRTNARIAGRKLSTQGITAWEAYTNGAYRQFLAGGGRLLRRAGGGLLRRAVGGMLGQGAPGPSTSASGRPPLPPLAGLVQRAIGGQLGALPAWKKGKKASFKEATLAEAGLGPARFRAARARQSDRIAEFDHIGELSDVDDRRYATQERRNDLTEEEYVNDKGEVSKPDIDRRVGELNKLEAIKRRMIRRLEQAKRLAKRVQRTYKTIVRRLRAALKAATKKGKNGKVSKARRAAAASYRKQIADYQGRIGEWRGKERDLGLDLEDARIDMSALQGEEKSVKGTTAVAPEVEAIDTPDDTSSDTSTDSSSSSDGGGDTSTGDTPAPENAPATAEQIAEGVLSALNTYQASSADLYSSFGANFMAATGPVSGNPMTGFGAPGVRYYGADSGGSDGGVVRAAGGRSLATEAAAGGGITQNLYFTGPQPPDPHTLTATALHELQAQT